MAALRELVLKLSANTVEFRRDLNTAARSVNDLSSQIERSFQSAKNTLVGFAAAVASVASLDALAEGIHHTAEALAELDDMSQKTGSSVENLSRLAKVAHAFGGDAAAVNLAMNNLARGMAGADEESDKTRQALEALGIATDHIAERDPSAVFIEIAKALQSYRDGAAKAAIMTDLFKKGAVDLLPYINNVANGLELFGSTSEEAAQQGTRFNNQLRLLHVRMDEVKEEVVSAMLPAFSDFLQALNEIGKDSAELAHNDALSQWAQSSVTAFAMVINAAEGAARIVSLIAHQIAALLAMVQADGAQARKAITDAYSDQQDTLLTKPLLGQQVMAQMEKIRQQREAASAAAAAAKAANGGEGKSDQRPTLNYGGMNDKNKLADLIKHQAEAEIHALEALIAQEKQILESRNRFLDYYNTENLLSFRDYFTARQAAQADELSATLRFVDAEIAANRKIKQSATTESARTGTQSHINELLQKKIELQRQGSEEAILGSLKEAKAYQDLARDLRGLQADLLDLQGKAGEAAKIRIVDQDRTIRLRLTVEGNDNGLALLDTLEKAKIAQAEFNQLTAQAALIQERLHNEEERAAIAQYSGATTELDTLLKLSASRQQAVSELEAIVLSQERVAEASNNPALVNQANAARTALEKLRAESHLLEQKFRTVFVDSMSTALSDFVLGTKSARQAFKEFADSVVQQITRMASEAVSQQLFQALMGGPAGGKSGENNGSTATGSSSGGGGFGGGQGGGDLLGSLMSFGMSLFGGAKGGAVPSFNPDTINMGASVAGPLMSVGDLNSFPGLAAGGPVAANRPYYVGEFGKEVFVPNTEGRILPRSEFSSGSNTIVNITQNIPQEMSRHSANQLAADTGRQVNRAVRRNG